MDFDSDREMLDQLSSHAGMSITAMAKKAGLAVTTLTRVMKPDVEHELSKRTIQALKTNWPDFEGFGLTGDYTPGVEARAYLPVKILPSFAGAGGGGTGDGDKETGMISRHIIEDELKAKPEDLLLIDVRGDSMEPDFLNGDQILIDGRDKNLAQPGSFAVWDGDGYVVKLLERIPDDRSKLRVFSANSRYSPYEVLADELQILGRTVWFARRL